MALIGADVHANGKHGSLIPRLRVGFGFVCSYGMTVFPVQTPPGDGHRSPPGPPGAGGRAPSGPVCSRPERRRAVPAGPDRHRRGPSPFACNLRRETVPARGTPPTSVTGITGPTSPERVTPRGTRPVRRDRREPDPPPAVHTDERPVTRRCHPSRHPAASPRPDPKV